MQAHAAAEEVLQPQAQGWVRAQARAQAWPGGVRSGLEPVQAQAVMPQGALVAVPVGVLHLQQPLVS